MICTTMVNEIPGRKFCVPFMDRPVCPCIRLPSVVTGVSCSLTKRLRSRLVRLAISRKVVGKNLHDALFLTTLAVELTLFLSVSTRKHIFMAFRANILSNFSEEQRTQNHPQCLSGLSRALFPTTFLEVAYIACC